MKGSASLLIISYLQVFPHPFEVAERLRMPPMPVCLCAVISHDGHRTGIISPMVWAGKKSSEIFHSYCDFDVGDLPKVTKLIGGRASTEA